MKSFLVGCVLSTLYGISNGYSDKALSDKVTNLPNEPSGVDFDQYAGYITIDAANNKSIFYWFQESSTGAETSPVVLWTNGGPGCSGLAGALIEQGAFRIENNGNLELNEGRWNQIANMLFIEQPIGVGFSFSNDEKDYIVGDNQAAQDMYSFIIGWLKEFDTLSNNDFYLASESYGGHYMPMTAKYIVDHNTKNEINFKGFLVGNPLTDMVENAKGMYDTFYGHQLISYPLFKEWHVGCDDGENQNDTCIGLMNAMAEQVSDIYLYGLDWPQCNDASSLYSFKMQKWFMTKVIEQAFKRKMPFKEFEHLNKNEISKLDDNTISKLYHIKNKDLDATDNNEWNACQVDYLTEYLNTEDVQNALHAKVGTDWSLCSNVTQYNETDISNYMEPYYKYLIDGGYNLHIMIYSGDDDSVCGTLGTQSWIWNLNYTTKSSWKDWTYNNQNGGYYTSFQNPNDDGTAFTFVTVHSAGHQVPWYKPMKGFTMFSKYLSNDF